MKTILILFLISFNSYSECTKSILVEETVKQWDISLQPKITETIKNKKIKISCELFYKITIGSILKSNEKSIDYTRGFFSNGSLVDRKYKVIKKYE